MEQLVTLSDIQLMQQIAFWKFSERVTSFLVIIFLYISIIQLPIFFRHFIFTSRLTAELHQDIESDLHVGLENVENYQF